MTRAGAGSAPNDVHTPAGASRGEAILASAQVAIDPAGGELRFRHRYATQAGSDGGVLEIAIDDGAAQDIVSAGGVFRTGALQRLDRSQRRLFRRQIRTRCSAATRGLARRKHTKPSR